MARMNSFPSNRKVGGFFSNVYEDDYSVTKDDGTCYKTFSNYEEAKLYQDYLQQQENQERLVKEQKRTADELEALRKATEEKNRREQERPYRPPFSHSSNQFYDPEYKEWLRYKKETDTEFKKWKFSNDIKARKLEEERRQVAEAAESARKEQERKFREKKETELRPYEEDMLSKKKVACKLRVKVAKETIREEVMLRCVRDPAVSVFNALKENPNLTPVIQSIIAKKETSLKNTGDLDLSYIERQLQMNNGDILSSKQLLFAATHSKKNSILSKITDWDDSGECCLIIINRFEKGEAISEELFCDMIESCCDFEPILIALAECKRPFNDAVGCVYEALMDNGTDKVLHILSESTIHKTAISNNAYISEKAKALNIIPKHAMLNYEPNNNMNNIERSKGGCLTVVVLLIIVSSIMFFI